MERRVLLAGLLTGATAAPLVAGPALGQSGPGPGATTNVPPSSFSDAARVHLRDTVAAGALSLMMSRIALTKLKHPMTRQFAGFEVAEQDTIADVLRSRMTPGAQVVGDVRAPTDAEVEASLDVQGRDAVDRFRTLKAGPEFEKAYVAAQIEGHRRLLAIQDSYLKAPDDAEETAIAKLAGATIREHLMLLGDIDKHLG